MRGQLAATVRHFSAVGTDSWHLIAKADVLNTKCTTPLYLRFLTPTVAPAGN